MPEFCVLGGTGFVGRHLVSALCGQDQRALIKVLSRSRPANPLPGNVSWVKLDVTDINALKAGVGKAEVVYYLPGILAENRDQSYEEVHYEGVMHTLEALAGRSIRRLVHVSAVGAAINAPSAYHRTKKGRGGDRTLRFSLYNCPAIPDIWPGRSVNQPIFGIWTKAACSSHDRTGNGESSTGLRRRSWEDAGTVAEPGGDCRQNL